MFERSLRSFAVLGVTACFAAPCVWATAAHHASAKARPLSHTASSHTASSHTAGKHTVSAHTTSGHASHGRWTARAERIAVHHEAPPAMDPTRATEIQTALIRAGYLSGEPSGVWDADSITAMQKLQDDNGWQTKYTPDSRALVKLGLGAAPTSPLQPIPATETAQAVVVAQP